MPTQAINRETVSGEALFILRNLRENGRIGRSNKLAEVKAALEPSVSLEFDTYFFFLRKFHYIAMDREAQILLTDEGEQVVDGETLEKFGSEVDQFFFDKFSPDPGEQESDAQAQDLPEVTNPVGMRPPPPPSDFSEAEETQLASPPPPPPPTRAPPPPPPQQRKAAPPPSPLADEPLIIPNVTPAPAVTHAALPQAPIEPKREPSVPLPPLSSAAPAPMPVISAPTPPPAPAASASAAASAAAKGTELDVRYVKFDPIGSGPLGTVFKGRHNALGTDICIKELKDIFGYFSFLQRGEVIKRLKKELCAQAQVRHPNVVQILDQNTDVSRPYFVMEVLKGSLREKLDSNAGKGLPVPTAIRHFLQLCYALKAAHAQGLTHHNLKPENVLLDASGNAKLGDFGLTRVVEVDASKGLPQVFVGTGGMAYLAPELLGRGTREGGASADVYSLGILLYEMLTGQLPGRRSPLPSEVNDEVPSKLDPIFDKMTQDKVQSRYADFDAMLADFYGAFSDGEYLTRGDLILWSETPKT